ncbi:MAG: cation diffusion facilitator family transporter [Bryobacteraceae bacterium]
MHHARSKRTTSVMTWSLIVTVAYVIVETVAGLRAHSLALLSDAGHNFTDAFSLLLGAFGVYLQARPGDHRRTYGYQRAGVLAAFINAMTLGLVSAILLYESYIRLLHPEPVNEGIMIVVAAIALVVNLGIAWALGGHGDHHHDLNVRAAWIHQLGDAASCIGIIIGAVVMQYTGWHWIDPVLSILIGLAIIGSAWGILRDSLNILLEGLPKGLDLREVSRALTEVPGVIDVHDLHIWSLGSDSSALSCHILIEEMSPAASDAILKQLNQVLHARFDIHHTTIQFEHVRCVLAEMHCTALETARELEAAEHGHVH